MLVNALNVDLNVGRFGNGMPVIILHGWGVDSEIMKGFLEPIFSKRSGWERIYIDSPGHGRSGYPDGINSWDEMLDIIIDGIKQLIGNKPFLVIGLSYGAYLARGVIYKLKKQVKGLFLICPVIKGRDRDLPSHEVLVNSGSLDFSPGFLDMAVVQTNRVWERFKHEVIPGVQLFNTRLKVSPLISINQSFSFEDEMMTVFFDKPALIINGRQDSLVGYKDVFLMLESCPHATYAILDHAGHLVEIEQEKLVNPLIDEWLDRVKLQER